MSLVRERGMSIADILTHDLLVTLFEGDFPAGASKSKLVSEIGPFQIHYSSKWNKSSYEPTAIRENSMSRARRQPLEAYTTIGEFINGVFDSISSSVNHTISTCYWTHFLILSYFCHEKSNPFA